MSLPLPETKYALASPGGRWHEEYVLNESGYSTEQMQAYGQACREHALEEAAQFIESGSFLHDQSPAKLFAEQLAPKIRGLK